MTEAIFQSEIEMHSKLAHVFLNIVNRLHKKCYPFFFFSILAVSKINHAKNNRLSNNYELPLNLSKKVQIIKPFSKELRLGVIDWTKARLDAIAKHLYDKSYIQITCMLLAAQKQNQEILSITHRSGIKTSVYVGTSATNLKRRRLGSKGNDQKPKIAGSRIE